MSGEKLKSKFSKANDDEKLALSIIGDNIFPKKKPKKSMDIEEYLTTPEGQEWWAKVSQEDDDKRRESCLLKGAELALGE